MKDDCTKCYDCKNATCQCAFHDGFCNMMEKTKVAMYIDHIRVYQSKNDSAHVGTPHTLGCDTEEFPSREYIAGHEYRYMRGDPFSLHDKGPLKDRIKVGGGTCKEDSDCGGTDKGQCAAFVGGFFSTVKKGLRCECIEGFTGPYCKVALHGDDEPGVWELRNSDHIFRNIAYPALPTMLVSSMSILIAIILYTAIWTAIQSRRNRR